MKCPVWSMVVACVWLVSFAAVSANAAETAKESGSSGNQAAQANNPLANLKTFNLQNYYISDLSGTDESANQFWLRYAQPLSTPFGNWLVRASLPVSRVPVEDGTESGLGDANAFAAYLFDTGKPSLSLGVGPLFGFPTATDDALGTDQWSAGLAAVIFDASHPTVQWGGLVTYQHKIGGSSRAPDVNFLAVQPFGIVQMGSGYYLRSTGIWAFNLETGDYSVPLGLGVGKVLKVGSTVLNAYVEPQYSIVDEGPNQPQFQLFMGFNMQFYGL